MTKPLEGVKVVEVAGWTFVPSAGAVLADLGADVIKIEPPTGDPQRGLKNLLNIEQGAVNPFLEMPNRGKRSVTVDLTTSAGREVVLRLCEQADVFLTSYLPDARAKLGIDVADVRGRNDRIIYGRGSGWGAHGPMRGAGGYDLAAGWATSGMAHVMQSPTGEPNLQPRAFFDLIGGNTIAGAVCAALFQRERTGHGDVIDVSLMGVGMWALAMDITGAPYAPAQGQDRTNVGNVLSNVYPTSDGRWIYFVCLQSDRFWAEFCELIGVPQFITDERFTTSDARYANRTECVAALDEVFSARALAEWTSVLDGFTGVWAPVLSFAEVANHPQVAPNGYFPAIEAHDGTKFRIVSAPVRFGDQDTVPTAAAPEIGQHTEVVLLESGFEWDEIAKLRDDGALG